MVERIHRIAILIVVATFLAATFGYVVGNGGLPREKSQHRFWY